MSLRLRPLKMRVLRSRRHRAGFTIVELSVVAAVSVTIAGIAAHMYLAANNTVAFVAGQGVLQMELTQAADALKRDVAEAYEVPLNWTSTGFCPSSSGTLWRDPDSTADGVARLILKTAAISPTTGQPQPAIPDFFVYTFNSSTGILQREVCTTQPANTSRTRVRTVLGRAITRVVWSWGNINEDLTGRLEITMQLWGARPGHGRNLTLLSRAVLRNTPP